MISTKNIISILELRGLLYALRDSRPDICVRFRLMGEMWQTKYMRVSLCTEQGIAFNEEQTNKFFLIPDLSKVMQFEIDKAFQQYQPHFHYSTDPTPVA